MCPQRLITSSKTGLAGGLVSFTIPILSILCSLLFAVQPAFTATIWSGGAVPGVVDGGPDSPVELGVKFRSDVAGTVTGIRFYKASANTGTHVGNLWTDNGTLQATATFTNETASGWQQVNFASPVAIAANTVYVASYHANAGHYSADEDYFSATGVDNAPLHALASGVSGGNGVYAYGAGSLFPNQTWNTANYWVDVVFQAGAAPTLTSIAVTPANPTILTGTLQQFTATGTYSDSTTQNITTQATWVSSNTTVATINASGLASGISAGTAAISAALAGRTGSTILTVVPAPEGEGLGDYRSVSSGVWTTAAIWQTNNGTAWVAASRPPTNNTTAGVITIRSGHTVTATASVRVDQVVVEAGGQITLNSGVTLTLANGTGIDLEVFGSFQNAGTITLNSGATINFQSGGTYQHNRTAGTIPTATWAATSTCLITGITSALPGGLAQTFGHFTWNCTGQSAALNLETSMNIAGDFTVISTGSSTLRLLNSTTARTMTVSGNYRQTGGTFNLKNNSGNAALNISGAFIQTGGTFTLRSGNASGSGTVTVAGNFSLTTGTFNLSSIGAVGTLNVGGDFSHASGTITETSTGSGSIIFTSGLHTYTSGGTIANTINFTVNSGATLMMGTSLLGNGSIGTFTLLSGATLGIGGPAGITISEATGNIRVTGTRSFNTGANYIYNGTGAQAPGNGLPITVNNLTIANAAGLTVNSTHTVNGTCVVNSGARLLGTGRIINGDLVLSGTVAPGVSVGRFTSDGETWNGGAIYNWEINDATGAPGTGWDLLSLTTGKGIDLQATTANPFTVKLITLNGASPGLAANFSKSSSYIWTIAITTNATVTNFAANKFLIDTTQFSNDFGGGTFSVEQSGAELRVKFDAITGALTINTTSFPNGTHNVPYTATLTASGGTTPYSFSIVSGFLPPGVAMNPANGAITGTPTATGVFSFTAQVSDAGAPIRIATQPLSITVVPTLTSIAVTPVNPSILSGATQQFTATGTYSDGSTQNLTTQATWTSSSTAVATINTTGLATAASPGNSTISAALAGRTGNTLLTVQAVPLLVINTASLSTGTAGVGYSAALAASGGTTPYRWSLFSGSLPPGLTLNTNSGVISGTPTTDGTFNFTARVRDTGNPVQTTNKALSITTVIAAGISGLIGNTNEGTSTDFIWDNGPWINASRFLATSNMTVSTMRAKVVGISGKYKCAIYAGTATQPGQFLGESTEISNPGSGWQSFPLVSAVPLTNGQNYWLAIWSDNAAASVYYSDTLGTLRWGQFNYGAWPNSLTTSGGGTLKYCIYATATAATLSSITVTPANPTITNGGSQQFTATGTYSDGSTHNISSQAAWISSNTVVATINASGLATAASSGTTTISAVFAGKTGSALLTVQSAALTITTTSLAAGTVGVAYSATLAASGGTTPYRWSLDSGSLPPGLTLNTNSGAIAGTPTTAGTFSFTAQVRDNSNPIKTATKPLSITITPGAEFHCGDSGEPDDIERSHPAIHGDRNLL